MVFDLLLQLVEFLDFARLGELGQFFQVDDADLGGLRGLFELLEQPVDRFQLFLDLQGLGHGHRRAAGELVLAGQLVDLVLVAQRSTSCTSLPGEARAIVAGLIPEPLQLANLLVVKALGETASAGCAGGFIALPCSR